MRSTTYRVAPDRPQAAAGADHALVIESTTLWAWGHGVNGQLGQGTNKPQMQKDRLVVPHTEAVFGVWAAGDNSLFLDEKGDLWAFGSGPWPVGEDAYLVSTGTPFRVPLPSGVRAVSAAVSELGGVWAIDQNGKLWVWGMNGQGSFGIGTGKSEVRTPVEALDDAVFVAAGPYHALVLQKDGELWVAGLHDGTGSSNTNKFNRLGTGDNAADQPSWTSLGTWPDPLSVGAEADHSWLLTASGDLWVWGDNAFGQLSYPPEETSRVDQPTKVAEDIALVGAGTRFTLLAPEEGTLFSWGEMASGMPLLRARDGLRSIRAGTGFVLVVSGGFHEASSNPWTAVHTWGELFF